MEVVKMNIETTLEWIWSAVNSPVVIAAAAAALAWALSKLYTAKPEWRKYEGTIVSAVKWAEKAIPDDSPNAGAARLDKALKYVLAAYEEATGHEANSKITSDLSEGIQITHAELEAAGTLEKTKTETSNQ